VQSPEAVPFDELPDDVRDRGIDVLRGLAADGRLRADALESAIGRVLAARTEDQFAAIMESLPPPVALTPQRRRMTEPLRLRAGMRGLRLSGRWQLAARTTLRAELGRVIVDLTEAEFDALTVDLDVYTGWGSVTILVPDGVGVQVIRHHGALRSELDPPLPGLPLVRLDARTNVGTIRLRKSEVDPERGRGRPRRQRSRR
jgi:hypothetical protein